MPLTDATVQIVACKPQYTAQSLALLRGRATKKRAHLADQPLGKRKVVPVDSDIQQRPAIAVSPLIWWNSKLLEVQNKALGGGGDRRELQVVPEEVFLERGVAVLDARVAHGQEERVHEPVGVSDPPWVVLHSHRVVMGLPQH